MLFRSGAHVLQLFSFPSGAPASVRRGLHAKVADALVGVGGGDPDWRLVAAHYERAERFDEAASAYRQASTVARLRGALAEARTY